MQERQPRARRQVLNNVALGYVAAVAVVVGMVCWFANAELALANQAVPPAIGSPGMITHVLRSEVQPTRVIVIDPELRVMAVYEIGREKAEIEFLSSRNFSYDMQMLGYNSVEPTPESIKKMLETQ
jgi:hypothetical protein